MVLKTFKIGESGYYAYRKRLTKIHTTKDALLKIKIRRIFYEHKSRYGSRRIKKQLKKEGIICSRPKIVKYMKMSNLQALRYRSFKPKTTDSNHSLGHFPNLLKIDGKKLQTTSQDEVWVADITYIKTELDNFCYLATIMDLHSRRIIAHSFKKHMKTQLCLETLQKAIKIRQPRTLNKKLIHHSDRGSQYASHEYTKALEKQRIEGSMSAKACCYDNANMESFFGTLKHELQIESFPNFETANHQISQYIKYYNFKRMHSAINYLIPVEFELLSII